MTARQIWEAVLTELNKTSTPSLLLHDFNYYLNKAINQYVNKRYNIYDVSLQTTDDLRVLKANAILDVIPVYDQRLKSILSYGTLTNLSLFNTNQGNIFEAFYEVIFPEDYLHILNCTCLYKVLRPYKCYNKGNYVNFSATKLTSDSWPLVMKNYYHRPSPERPYYYIHNINSSISNPTNWNNGDDKNGTDYLSPSHVTLEDGTGAITVQSSHPRTISLLLGMNNPIDSSIVERDSGIRYGNASPIRCEIRCGENLSAFLLEKVFIDYIKVPQTVKLTKEQIDFAEDTSQIMEFPDYVCYEITNELVILIELHIADPRLQTLMEVTRSIASPAQQLTS